MVNGLGLFLFDLPWPLRRLLLNKVLFLGCLYVLLNTIIGYFPVVLTSWLLSEMAFSLRCRTGCSLLTELAAESSCGEETDVTFGSFAVCFQLAELFRGTFREHLAVWGRRRLSVCLEVLQIYAVECNHVCECNLQHPAPRITRRETSRGECWERKGSWLNGVKKTLNEFSACVCVCLSHCQTGLTWWPVEPLTSSYKNLPWSERSPLFRRTSRLSTSADSYSLLQDLSRWSLFAIHFDLERPSNK